PAIQDVADAGYDIIFFGSTEYIPIIEKHQDEYKESKFVGFDIEPSTEIKMSNMFCITYMQNQVDFLAGALAQKMSKSGTIGFLGGTEGTIINDFLIG
ncbi:BMP family ABC transporter substrate-binding protein, partial [Clostridium sp. ATCC 29733]